MVAGHHHGDHHQHGQHASQAPRQRVRRLPDEGQSDEQVPTDVEARHRGVLVGEGRWLQHPVGVRVLGHGVDESEIHEPRRGHGEGRNDEHADQPGDEQRVAIDEEGLTTAPRQPAEHTRDDRPVSPDVDRVGSAEHPVEGERPLLEVRLHEDAERLLQADDPASVVHRGPGVAGGQAAHPEVDGHRRQEQQHLAQQELSGGHPVTRSRAGDGRLIDHGHGRSRPHRFRISATGCVSTTSGGEITLR